METGPTSASEILALCKRLRARCPERRRPIQPCVGTPVSRPSDSGRVGFGTAIPDGPTIGTNRFALVIRRMRPIRAIAALRRARPDNDAFTGWGEYFGHGFPLDHKIPFADLPCTPEPQTPGGRHHEPLLHRERLSDRVFDALVGFHVELVRRPRSRRRIAADGVVRAPTLPRRLFGHRVVARSVGGFPAPSASCDSPSASREWLLPT
jgi:hypothetical protein